MTITIDDESLEDGLAALGQQQGVRATKTRMALSILERALAACRESGNPEAWRAVHRDGHRKTSPAGPASTPDRGDDAIG